MTKLLTDKNTVFFDLETTGLKINEARIISIGAIKVNSDMEILDQLDLLVNPMMDISAEIESITGLHNFMLKKANPFRHIAGEVKSFFEGCNLGGFNLTRFDLPVLAEEFARLDIDFPTQGTKIIDAQVIYHVNNPRTLSAALEHYCNKAHSNAHNAMGDTIATIEVFDKQLETHDDVSGDIAALHEYSMRGKSMADWTRSFYYDDKGQLRYNFGQHKDRMVFESQETYKYIDWMLMRDFPQSTKLFIQKHIKSTRHIRPGESVPI